MHSLETIIALNEKQAARERADREAEKARWFDDGGRWFDSDESTDSEFYEDTDWNWDELIGRHEDERQLQIAENQYYQLEKEDSFD